MNERRIAILGSLSLNNLYQWHWTNFNLKKIISISKSRMYKFSKKSVALNISTPRTIRHLSPAFRFKGQVTFQEKHGGWVGGWQRWQCKSEVMQMIQRAFSVPPSNAINNALLRVIRRRENILIGLLILLCSYQAYRTATWGSRSIFISWTWHDLMDFDIQWAREYVNQRQREKPVIQASR